MKRRVTLLSLVILLLSGAVIASNQPAEEEYDEDEYGPAEDIVWTKPLESVFFSHKIHTMEYDFACDDCHDELFEMEAGAAEENDDFTMASMAEGNYCGACHDGDTAFEVDSSCGSCHTVSDELIVWTKPVKSVFFDHTFHVEEMELECESCHDHLFIMKAGDAEEKDDFTMESLYAGKYCGECHDGATAFASDTRCTACHIGVRGHARLKGEKAGANHGGTH